MMTSGKLSKFLLHIVRTGERHIVLLLEMVTDVLAKCWLAIHAHRTLHTHTHTHTHIHDTKATFWVKCTHAVKSVLYMKGEQTMTWTCLHWRQPAGLHAAYYMNLTFVCCFMWAKMHKEVSWCKKIWIVWMWTTSHVWPNSTDYMWRNFFCFGTTI